MINLTTTKKEASAGLGKNQRAIMEILDTFDLDDPNRPFFPPASGATLASIPAHVVYLSLDEIAFYFSPDDFESQHDNVYRTIRALERRGLVGISMEKDVTGDYYVCCWSLVREIPNLI